MALSDSRRAMIKHPEIISKQQEMVKKETAAAGGGGGGGMNWLEKYVEKIDKEMSEVKVSLRDMCMEMKHSLKETEDRITAMLDRDLTEMRERDTQRQAEIKEIKNEFKEFKVAQEGTRQEILAFRGETRILHTDNNKSRADVGELKADVRTLKNDVGTLKTDVSTLKTNVQDLRKDLHKETGMIMRWVLGFTATMVIGFISVLATLLRR